MRRLTFALVVAVSTIALTHIASAADLGRRPVYKAPPPPPPPVISWTGFYVGINGGYGWDSFKYPYDISCAPPHVCMVPALDPFGAGEAELRSNGFFGGGQIGYNWQFAPTWVAGVEADIQGADISDTATVKLNDLSANASAKLDWFGTVRGRVGYLITPTTLLYATGGWAYGHTKTSVIVPSDFEFSLSHDRSGWTVGGGLEYAFNSVWSLKAEYLYMDLGQDNVFNGIVNPWLINIDEKTTVHTIKVGLNFRFNGLGL